MRRPTADIQLNFVTAEEFARRPRPAEPVAPADTLQGQLRRRPSAAASRPVVADITVVEDGDRATVYLPDAEPTSIRAAVDAAAAAGQMARLAGKTVNIDNDSPALVAAFVYAAKPWLRWFSVAGQVVVPRPA